MILYLSRLPDQQIRAECLNHRDVGQLEDNVVDLRDQGEGVGELPNDPQFAGVRGPS